MLIGDSILCPRGINFDGAVFQFVHGLHFKYNVRNAWREGDQSLEGWLVDKQQLPTNRAIAEDQSEFADARPQIGIVQPRPNPRRGSRLNPLADRFTHLVAQFGQGCPQQRILSADIRFAQGLADMHIAPGFALHMNEGCQR